MSRYSMAYILEQIGRLTADQLADEVRKAGIKGRPGTTYSCPLARLFRVKFQNRFIIGRNFIIRHTTPGSNAVSTEYSFNKAKTPKGCIEFVAKFDHGDYPDIIDRSYTGGQHRNPPDERLRRKRPTRRPVKEVGR